MTTTRGAAALIALLAMVGCGTTQAPQVAVAQPGLVIAGGDGSFQVSSTQPAPTPFVSGVCNLNPREVGVESWQRALQEGARQVIIRYPDVEQPLFGVLKLCSLRENAQGPWQREYLLDVASSYVDATTQARVSVIYELYPPSPRSVGYAWILWISRLPFQAMGAVPANGRPQPGDGAPPGASGGRPPPTGASPPGAKGLLIVTSDPPGARITVDGTEVGNAPARYEAIPGEHLIGATWPDGASEQQPGTVNAGSSTVVQVRRH
jgi:hypothetical protein